MAQSFQQQAAAQHQQDDAWVFCFWVCSHPHTQVIPPLAASELLVGLCSCMMSVPLSCCICLHYLEPLCLLHMCLRLLSLYLTRLHCLICFSPAYVCVTSHIMLYECPYIVCCLVVMRRHSCTPEWIFCLGFWALLHALIHFRLLDFQ